MDSVHNSGKMFEMFKESCKLFETSRSVTERKKQISIISEFLNESAVLQTLDNNQNQLRVQNQSPLSQSNQLHLRGQLDWNSLFLMIKNFALSELKFLSEKYNNTSISGSHVSSQNDNRLLQLRGFMNVFFNQINSRNKNNMNLNWFIEFYKRVFEDFNSPASLRIFSDLSCFLLNNVLTSHDYCCEIRKSFWLELINIFMVQFMNYLDTSASIDPLIALKCLKRILYASSAYFGYFNPFKLFSFFNMAFLTLRKDASNELLENLLESVQICSKLFYVECSFEICKLGEEIFIKLIEIFNDKKSSFSIKELTLDIFLFQVNLHSELKLNKFNFTPKWMDSMNLLLPLIVDELETSLNQKLTSTRLKFSKSGSFNKADLLTKWEETLIKLTGKLLNELISEEYDLSEDLEASMRETQQQTDRNESELHDNEDEDQVVCSSRHKKRKVQISYSLNFLLNKLRDERAKTVWSLIMGDFLINNQSNRNYPIQFFQRIFQRLVNNEKLFESIRLDSTELADRLHRYASLNLFLATISNQNELANQTQLRSVTKSCLERLVSIDSVAYINLVQKLIYTQLCDVHLNRMIVEKLVSLFHENQNLRDNNQFKELLIDLLHKHSILLNKKEKFQLVKFELPLFENIVNDLLDQVDQDEEAKNNSRTILVNSLNKVLQTKKVLKENWTVLCGLLNLKPSPGSLRKSIEFNFITEDISVSEVAAASFELINKKHLLSNELLALVNSHMATRLKNVKKINEIIFKQNELGILSLITLDEIVLTLSLSYNPQLDMRERLEILLSHLLMFIRKFLKVAEKTKSSSEKEGLFNLVKYMLRELALNINGMCLKSILNSHLIDLCLEVMKSESCFDEIKLEALSIANISLRFLKDLNESEFKQYESELKNCLIERLANKYTINKPNQFKSAFEMKLFILSLDCLFVSNLSWPRFQFALELLEFALNEPCFLKDSKYTFYLLCLFSKLGKKLIGANAFRIYNELATESKSTSEEAKLVQCQEKYLQIVDNLSELLLGKSVQCQLSLMRVRATTIKLTRLRLIHMKLGDSDEPVVTKTRKALTNRLVADFDKLLAFVNSKCDRISKKASELMIKSCFNSKLFEHYLRKHLVDSRSNYSEAIDSIKQHLSEVRNFAKMSDDSFFDRFYSNQIESDAFAIDIEVYSLSNESCDTFEEKFNSVKKTYQYIKKNLEEPFLARKLITKTLKELLSNNKSIQKKCLVALMQLSIEYKICEDELVDSNLIGFYARELVFNWFDIYVDLSETAFQDLIDLANEKFPFRYFGFDKFADYLKVNLSVFGSIYVSKVLNEEQTSRLDQSDMINLYSFSQPTERTNPSSFQEILANQNQLLVEFYANIYLNLTEFDSIETQAKHIDRLVQSEIISIDLFNKNFHSIFEFMAVNRTLSDPLLDLLIRLHQQNANQRMSKSKLLVSLIQSSCTHFHSVIFSILSQLNYLLFTSTFLQEYFLDSNQTFIEKFLFDKEYFLPAVLGNKSSNSPQTQLLIDFIAINSVNSIDKLVITKLKSMENPENRESSEKNLNNLSETFESSIKLINAVFNQFRLLLEVCSQIQTDNNWALSAITWKLLDYLNMSLRFKELYEFNVNLFGNLFALIQKYASKCAQFRMQVNFCLLLVKNFQHANKLSKSNTLMMNLNEYIAILLKSQSLTTVKINYNVEDELKLCLSLADLKRKQTSRYTFCYLVHLILAEYHETFISNEHLMPLISQSVQQMIAYLINEESTNEQKELLDVLLSLIGPIELDWLHLTKNHFAYYETNLNIRVKQLIEHLKKSNPIYPFYHIFIEYLFELLLSSCAQDQHVANESLNKVFQMTESSLFMLDYERSLAELKLNEEEQSTFDYKFLNYSKMFISKKKLKPINEKSSLPALGLNQLDNESLWSIRKSRKSYTQWLKDLVVFLIKFNSNSTHVLLACVELFEKKLLICEYAFPYLINAFLLNEKFNKVVAINLAKACCFADVQINESIDSDLKQSIKTLITTLEFLRRDSIHNSGKSNFWTEGEHWKHFDFLQLAKAAHLADLHLNVILYIEIWHSKQHLKHGKSDELKSNPLAIELLLNAYKQCGEKDPLDSDLIYLIEPSKQMKLYESDNLSEMVHFYDKYLYATTQTVTSQNEKETVTFARKELLNKLKLSGLDYVLINLMKSTTFSDYEMKAMENSSELSDIKYHTSWHLTSWNENDRDANSNENDQQISFNKYLFTSFKSLSDELKSPGSGFLNTHLIVDQCKSFLLNELISANQLLNTSNELIANIYAIEQVRTHCLISENKISTDEFLSNNSRLFKSYEEKRFPVKKSFKLLDDLLTIRIFLLKQLFAQQNKEESRDKLSNHISNLYECLVENSILYKRYQIGESYVNEMRKYCNDELRCDLNEAQILYAQANLKKAKFVMKNSLDKFELSIKRDVSSLSADNKLKGSIEYLIRSFDFYAKLLNENKFENPTVIINNYLEKAIDYINKTELRSEKHQFVCNAFLSLGKFADKQYQSMCEYIKSTAFEQHAELMKKFQAEKACAQIVEPNSYFNLILNKQIQIDREEIKTLIDDQDVFLCKAIENYVQFLHMDSSNGQEESFCIFRLVSLWTQNSKNSNANESIKEKVFNIGTYKFIPLMHQLAARMSLNTMNEKSNNESLFQSILIKLLLNIANDHPHHMLPIVLAFSNSHKDILLTSKTEKNSTERAEKEINEYLMNEDRVNTANFILNQLKSKSARNKQLIEMMSTLCDAYIELANTSIKVKPNSSDAIAFPKHLLINKVKNFNLINVLTTTIPIEQSGNYDQHLVSIVKFESTLRMANGVNLPKIVNCLGSDGQLRKQLVKGRDDLRQDAVMQQFFRTVNHLIHCNNVNNTNQLNLIRTYKIVPLSQKSGVLEWCENTITLGDWLIGKNQDGGAHRKYEPTDWKFDECKRKLHDAFQTTNKRAKTKSKLDTFLEICENIRPVFRYFFMENFLDASVWFKRRLNYTKSVATASIVGYIVGLGDRHVQNILIDQTNADIVHIDLGIAFDQGKILPIPETVPFRLTRDIVDGFGVLGVDGLFKNNCEAILDLLKRSSEQIMTIFEVLLYDPNYNWQLSPKKAYMLQHMTSTSTDNALENINPLNSKTSTLNSTAQKNNESTNKIAERILFQLKQKLLGYENGVQLSSNGQINYLINEATNPENLCRIYAGWQAYL